MRPPTLSWATRSTGIFSAAAPTWMASYGPCSAHPFHPSPVFVRYRVWYHVPTATGRKEKKSIAIVVSQGKGTSSTKHAINLPYVRQATTCTCAYVQTQTVKKEGCKQVPSGPFQPRPSSAVRSTHAILLARFSFHPRSPSSFLTFKRTLPEETMVSSSLSRLALDIPTNPGM